MKMQFDKSQHPDLLSLEELLECRDRLHTAIAGSREWQMFSRQIGFHFAAVRLLKKRQKKET